MEVPQKKKYIYILLRERGSPWEVLYNFGNHFGAIFVTYGHSLETVKFLHPFVRELHIEGFEAGKNILLGDLVLGRGRYIPVIRK